MAKGGIEINTKQLDRLTIELKGFEDKVGEAAFHALNRTIDYTITQIGRIVPKEYAVKANEVKATLRGRRPSNSDLSASIESKGHTLSLAHFPHSPQKPPVSGRKYTVKAKIKKDAGQKVLKTNPKAFVATTGARATDKTQYNVFMRIGDKRLPIKVIRTLSIPQMITNDNVGEQILKSAQEKLDERLEHEITFRMTSTQKKISR